MRKLLNGVYEFRTRFDEIVTLMALDLMEDSEEQIVKCLSEGYISNEKFEASKRQIAKAYCG